MNNWVSYRNGNYDVYINTLNGTKIRKNDLDFLILSFLSQWISNLPTAANMVVKCVTRTPHQMVNTETS